VPDRVEGVRDADADGLPDYREDTNGNGTYDAGADLSDFNSADTDGDGVSDYLEWLQGRKGREHLDSALARGKGVILLGAHFSTLDLGGLLFSEFYPVDAMYRRHNNPLMEDIITRGRGRYFGQSIERSDIRSVIRALRKNHIIWYAPDQDFGSKQSVYAPFFGVPAATIKATTRIVKLNDSPILMLAQHRLPDNSYELELLPVIEPFPSGDEAADAARINAELERAIRKDPAQYMWVHRRFKTHPEGKNYLYQNSD
jgi:KDO2-lipid IV(A) lauroyltransferase